MQQSNTKSKSKRKEFKTKQGDTQKSIVYGPVTVALRIVHNSAIITPITSITTTTSKTATQLTSEVSETPAAHTTKFITFCEIVSENVCCHSIVLFTGCGGGIHNATKNCFIEVIYDDVGTEIKGNSKVDTFLLNCCQLQHYHHTDILDSSKEYCYYSKTMSTSVNNASSVLPTSGSSSNSNEKKKPTAPAAPGTDVPGSTSNNNVFGQWAMKQTKGMIHQLTTRKYGLPDKTVASQILMYRQLLHTSCRPGLKLSRKYQGTPAQLAVRHMPWWSKDIDPNNPGKFLSMADTGIMLLSYDNLISRLWYAMIRPTATMKDDDDDALLIDTATTAAGAAKEEETVTTLDDDNEKKTDLSETTATKSKQQHQQKPSPPVPHSDWVDTIGFQQPDPVTDFRSGGMLSLALLVHIVESCPSTFARFDRNTNTNGNSASVLPFGITCINITDMISKFLMLSKSTDRMDALLSQKPFWYMFTNPSAILVVQELALNMLADVVDEIVTVRQLQHTLSTSSATKKPTSDSNNDDSEQKQPTDSTGAAPAAIDLLDSNSMTTDHQDSTTTTPSHPQQPDTNELSAENASDAFVKQDDGDDETKKFITVFDFSHILSVTERRVEYDLLGAGPRSIGDLRTIHTKLIMKYKIQLSNKLQQIRKDHFTASSLAVLPPSLSAARSSGIGVVIPSTITTTSTNNNTATTARESDESNASVSGIVDVSSMMKDQMKKNLNGFGAMSRNVYTSIKEKTSTPSASAAATNTSSRFNTFATKFVNGVVNTASTASATEASTDSNDVSVDATSTIDFLDNNNTAAVTASVDSGDDDVVVDTTDTELQAAMDLINSDEFVIDGFSIGDNDTDDDEIVDVDL